MPTRNISLTAEQDAFVENVVRAGEYQNASEAVRDALRVLHVGGHYYVWLRSRHPAHRGARAELMEQLAYRQMELADRSPLPIGRA
jgi:putative addiction module CopG family antidote